MRRNLDPEKVIDLSHGRTNHDLVELVAPWLDAARESATMIKLETSDVSTIQAHAGAIRLTRALSRASWAIVTSADPSVAEARLTAAHIPRPRVLVTAADVRYGKPHPDCYLTAAHRLRVAPEDCIVFEDAPSGVTAGRAAGCRTIGLAGTVDPSRLHADIYLQSLGDLTISARNVLL
jgi:sugar-phosphatase